jgi:hypothetical protein
LGVFVPYPLRLQLFLQLGFPLMELAEAVDLFLVLATDLGVISRRRLIFFRKLQFEIITEDGR